MAKKVQISCWIDPETKTFLEEKAKRESREPGNLSALLVEWAAVQLKKSGNSIELMENWEAVPRKDHKKGKQTA